MTSQPLIRVVRSSESLKAIPYDNTTAAEPPTPITAVTPPRPSKLRRITGLGKPKLPPKSKCPRDNVLPAHREDDRRDSGLAPSSSTARNSRTTLNTEVDSNRSLRHSPSLPQLSSPDGSGCLGSTSLKRWDVPHQGRPEIPPLPQMPFIGLVTEIPTGRFDDLSQPGQIEFSNRGSMLLGGKKANPTNASLSNGTLQPPKPSVHLSPPTSTAPKRVLSADEQILSSKVRSMYEDGTDKASNLTLASRLVVDEDDANASSTSVSRNASTPPPVDDHSMETAVKPREGSRSPSGTTRKISLPSREAKEMAGGIEDWENVNNGDVDRYGFIVPRKASRDSSVGSGRPQSPDPPRLQRVSTALQVASETPRKYRGRVGRDPSSARSPARSASAFSNKRPSSRNDRPPSSPSSLRGTLGGTQSKIRSTTNKLPHRRNHRYLDEAGDMLTLPPGLADIDEHQEDSRAAEDSRHRERAREEKWRKMARIVNPDDKSGGGMVFDFDTRSTKVIERTWKGIPDRWRATAWHAFLTSSAKRRGGLPSDDDLKAEFHKLLEQGSPDDVQIDIDVPRTINSHIMFRRRYRGGQRLLFRVLHCLSIYFPDTGYVQGMAALAATLLCYFDEEMTFVMLVRLWQLRGLERLYQSGFEGLMQALEEFETGWLANGVVSQKLKQLDIFPTAYGTRWYLTLFNYSIPFPAQLRVWDVFMLLGDPDEKISTSTPRKPVPTTNGDVTNGVRDGADDTSYHGGLDVLHAVSAALIDGTREILLDSDFENAMKVLTSWIPIRDEELLMRVAKAEWKMHRRKK
ncbi:MAG: hypothetical protein L6R42_003240 [Xanthoria sp. 1 TBL-2021]|nr:MAG: hypothetical protein L6R42_003240 [Xanthoria sp. 1 TBL-2021]